MHLRIFIFLLLLFDICRANAQKLSGLIKDAATQLPIVNVQIYTSRAATQSDQNGRFTLNGLEKGTLISCRLIGYETIEFSFGIESDTVLILKPIATNLKEITVVTKRNYKLDSINLRKEYAAIFNAKKVKIGDVFTRKDPNYKSTFPGMNPNSTSSLVGVDLLKVVALLGNNRSRETKLKSTLLQAENDTYIDRVFTKEIIIEITGLQGDSLVNFMNLYRPSIATLKKMTSYELNLYIKKCYTSVQKKRD